MNETVAFDNLFQVSVTFVDTSLFQTTSLFGSFFFGIIKHLLDLTSSNIQLIVPLQNNIGLSFAQPNIIPCLDAINWMLDSASSNKCIIFTAHYMLFIYSLYIHKIFTIYSLYVHYIFTIYSLLIHYMFIIFSLYIHHGFTVCSLYIHYIYTICSLYFHNIFTICPLYFHYMFTMGLLYIHYMFTIYSLYINKVK